MPSSKVVGRDEAWGPFYGNSRELIEEARERHVLVWTRRARLCVSHVWISREKVWISHDNAK